MHGHRSRLQTAHAHVVQHFFKRRLFGGQISEIGFFQAFRQQHVFRQQAGQGFLQQTFAQAHRIGAVHVFDLVFDGTEKNVEIDADIDKIREMNWKITGAPSMEKFLKVVDDFVQKKIDVPQLTEMVKNEPDPLTAFMITSKMFTFVDDFADLHTLAASKLKDKFPKEDWADQYVLLAGELQKSKSRCSFYYSSWNDCA